MESDGILGRAVGCCAPRVCVSSASTPAQNEQRDTRRGDMGMLNSAQRASRSPSAPSLRGDSLACRERQTHRAPGSAFERAMHRAGVSHEVGTRPDVTYEEFVRLQVAFQTVAGSAGHDKVAGIVRTAAGQRDDMIERCGPVVEMRGTVDAALSAVA